MGRQPVKVTGQAKRALREAIYAAGGVRMLARELGISHSALIKWQQAPPVRVLEIERLTGVRRERLRPDLYPSEG